MVVDFVEKDEFGIYAPVLKGAPVECILQLCDTGPPFAKPVLQLIEYAVFGKVCG
ncbi:hypothetical protein DPMN_068057 [Dreissena polymorpha]|uniref:Uncharacterized protein n=1 Tax=Dreissena polymorpha TaxID=45954 RepID=A0A9D4BU04_DREPO|nr:hypothetical protein DPMN_068057 [Dreissena polymorpha]